VKISGARIRTHDLWIRKRGAIPTTPQRLMSVSIHIFYSINFNYVIWFEHRLVCDLIFMDDCIECELRTFAYIGLSSIKVAETTVILHGRYI